MTKSLRLGVLTAALASAGALSESRPPSRGHPAELDADGGVSIGALYVKGLPPAAQAALWRDGQVVLDQQTSSSGPSLVRAVVRFQRPRSEVFTLITRPSEQHTFLPHVQASTLWGESSPQGERDDFVVAFLFTFKYRTQHWFYPEEHRVEWNLDPTGGDGLEEQLGHWQLYELDERTTIAEYGTHIRARGALLNFFRSVGERGAVRDALVAFRHHIDTASP
jgi:hypothetical protein